MRHLMLTAGLALAATGCTTIDEDGEPLDGADIGYGLRWDELVTSGDEAGGVYDLGGYEADGYDGQAAPGAKPAPAGGGRQPPGKGAKELDDAARAAGSLQGFGASVVPKGYPPRDEAAAAQIHNARAALLPPALRHDPRLAALAASQPLASPVAYEGGVLGLAGSAKVFLTTADRAPTDTRLYWVMVKVLSEKYGCFMTAKQSWQNATRVTCRDRRQIVFWTQRNGGLVQFHARQFDGEGYEIAVRQRRIVRISNARVL